MQFARALREQFRFLRINTADKFFDQDGGRRGLILQFHFAREDAFVVAADVIERHCPGVGFACDRILEQTNDGRLRFVPAIFDRAAKRRYVVELRALG